MWTIVYGYRNKSRTYYIIVVRSRIVAELHRLRKEVQELVLEGLQLASRRYEVYLGAGSEPKKAGLEDVRSSLNLGTIVYLAVYKLVLAYL